MKCCVLCLPFIVIGHVASLFPPSSIGVDIESGEKAVVRWQPPLVGNYSYFNLSVMSLSDPSEIIRKTSSLGKQRTFLDLTPGATYEAQVYTVYDDEESQDHISTNFTTRPNTSLSAPGALAHRLQRRTAC